MVEPKTGPKVVAIRDGHRYANPHEPDQSVIDELKDLLAKAESGEIIGIGWASLYYDGVGTNHYAGRISRNTVGQLFAVATRMTLAIDREP